MNLASIIENSGVKLLTGNSASPDIDSVFAGDKVSDLLNAATHSTLIVTNLNGLQLMRLAELMDVPAICLLNGVEPDGEIIQAAREQGTALLISPAGMFETCGRIHRCLYPDGQ